MDYYIKDPGPITETNLATGELLKDRDGKEAPPLTTKTLFVNTLMNDMRFTANFKAMRAAHNIVDAVEHQKGGWWKVSDADYDILKQVVEEPKFHGPQDKEIKGYPSAAFVIGFPILSSIMNATTEVPPEWKE